MANYQQNITIENAHLKFKNFSGAPGKFNAQGNRNFNVLLNDEMTIELSKRGWNVKPLKPAFEGDPVLHMLPVTVSYRKFPPKIVLVTSKGKTVLGEDDLYILDFAEFTNIDLTINPSFYDRDGRKGIKAYLRTMFATIYEDELERKYMDIPDSAINSIVPNEPF